MGKWSVSEGHPDHGIISGDGRLIAMVTTDEDNPQEPEEVRQNAALLAAAPELLVALRLCRTLLAEWVDSGSADQADSDAVRIASAAISKAEGRVE